jgi:exopolysaccharide biosynthesis polyprenyl glycosylphosphotransferase
MALRAGVDLLLLSLAVAAAIAGAPAAGVADTAIVWVLPPLAVGLLAGRGNYRPSLHASLIDRVTGMVGPTSLAAMVLVALDAVANPGTVPELLVRAWLLGIVYLACGRILLFVARRRARVNGLVGQPTLIVGAGQIGAQIERRLFSQPEIGLVPVGYLDAEPVPIELVPGRRSPILGDPAELGRIADETGARHVVFAFTTASDQSLVPLVRECERRDLGMSLVPRFYESINSRVVLEHMGGLPLYALRSVDPRGWQFAVKHILGRLIAVIMLLVLSPLMVALALVVRLSSRGPVIFGQRRIGRDGHEFDLYKFRSMRVANDPTDSNPAEETTRPPLRDVSSDVGPGGLEGALRVTPIGSFIRKTSLDELPQLWNVVRGDMTLVGPRPERPEFVEIFGQSINRYDDRHRVKSGITGWAQVHGLRGQTSLADRVEWDNYYIANWSLWLDTKILLMTLIAPFRPVE